ncbi:MAG: hypothetical protein QOH07_2323 [Mycobacterium sp.]|jgi:hypothetical protein|nr:hypothetical protein [Mycobacterium sp.]
MSDLLCGSDKFNPNVAIIDELTNRARRGPALVFGPSCTCSPRTSASYSWSVGAQTALGAAGLEQPVEAGRLPLSHSLCLRYFVALFSLKSQ